MRLAAPPMRARAALAALASGAVLATASCGGAPIRSTFHLPVHSTLGAHAGGGHKSAGHAESPATAGPVVNVATSPSGTGWWDVTAQGDVIAGGDAVLRGSMAGSPLNQPIVGIASTPRGQGYWLVARDGGIFSFGDAAFHGSTGAIHLNQPIVGMTTTPSGQGYWLVARDGGIFSFGDAAFHGSTGAINLNQPILGMASTPGGNGYWLVASDGGIFSFGDASFHGSVGGRALAAPVVAMAPGASGQGYWIVAANGEVFPFGDVPSVGGVVNALPAGVVGAASLPNGRGVRLISVDGASVSATAGAPATASAVPSSSSNAFTYLVANGDGTPARFDPCTAVHYVTNLAAAPAGAGAIVSGALDRISAATGVSFVNDGPTTEIPSNGRPAVQSRYGARWAPVIIAWAHSLQTDLLPGGSTIGEGGSSWVQQGGPKVFVTGEVAIDADRTIGLPVSFGAGSTLGELVLHELGHVMGLGHSADSSQLMYPTLVPVPSAAYGPGDLNGLAHVGRNAGCVQTPTAV